MKTHVAKAGQVGERWYVVDAEGVSLGRLATRVASVIRGKHRPDFTPHVDMGDHVIVVNADKVRITGSKLTAKTYTRYTGYQSGLRVTRLDTMLATKPGEVIAHAVRGMLPKGRLGRKLCRKLRVYAGAGHPHSAQKPEPLAVER